MATIQHNNSNSQAINQALTNYQSQNLSSAGYLETYLGNIDLLNPTFTAVNNHLITGFLANGDSFSFTGSNLQGFPSTLNSFSYTSPTGISFYATGALTIQNSAGASTGSLNTIIVEDNSGSQMVTYTFEGGFTAQTMQMNQLTVATSDFSFALTGNFSFDQNDMPIGTITGLKVTVDGQTNTIEDINLDIANFNQGGDYAAIYAAVTGGDDHITGGANDDQLQGSTGNDVIDGGEGNDTAIFNVNLAGIQHIRPLKSGGIEITSTEGTDILINIENFSFLDGSATIATLPQNQVMPSFSLSKDGGSSAVTTEAYTGPVTYLQYQLIGDNAGEVAMGTNGNDFINLLAGDDAANGGAGDDVLDGGVGSNFLSGGSGDDTFFLDGRSGENTWSTITDFSQDNVNIWGWVDGQSQLLLTQQSAGAVDFEGVTFHYDLNNDGNIDTSITFTGLTTDDVQASAQSVAGNGYLLIS